MNRLPVESSNIKSAGYENGVLELEFSSGGLGTVAGVPMKVQVVWQYDIPPELYAEFLAAPSKGKFFAAHIKNRPWTNARRVPAHVPRIAVVCGKRDEFVRWANEHPDLAGPKVRDDGSQFENAFAVMRAEALCGVTVDRVVYHGTYFDLPDIGEIVKTAAACVPPQEQHAQNSRTEEPKE